MSKFIVVIETPGAAIAEAGTYNSPAFNLTGLSQLIQMKSAGITGKVKLQQSIDGVNYHTIEESEQDVSALNAWNLCWFPAGVLCRAQIVSTAVDSAAVETLKMLSNE